jgi:hypothetical protein
MHAVLMLTCSTYACYQACDELTCTQSVTMPRSDDVSTTLSSTESPSEPVTTATAAAAAITTSSTIATAATSTASISTGAVSTRPVVESKSKDNSKSVQVPKLHTVLATHDGVKHDEAAAAAASIEGSTNTINSDRTMAKVQVEDKQVQLDEVDIKAGLLSANTQVLHALLLTKHVLCSCVYCGLCCSPAREH